MQLASVVGDVRLGGDPRVLAGLHGVLLGGQAERVEAHRVQHVVAGHAHVARVDVGADEAERMADMQPVAGRVREHVEHEQLRPAGHLVEPVASGPAGLGASNVPSSSHRCCQRVSISCASARSYRCAGTSSFLVAGTASVGASLGDMRFEVTGRPLLQDPAVIRNRPPSCASLMSVTLTPLVARLERAADRGHGATFIEGRTHPGAVGAAARRGAGDRGRPAGPGHRARRPRRDPRADQPAARHRHPGVLARRRVRGGAAAPDADGVDRGVRRADAGPRSATATPRCS